MPNPKRGFKNKKSNTQITEKDIKQLAAALKKIKNERLPIMLRNLLENNEEALDYALLIEKALKEQKLKKLPY